MNLGAAAQLAAMPANTSATARHRFLDLTRDWGNTMVTRSEDFRAAAEKVVSQMLRDLGVQLRYDEESIEWIDGYINRIRNQLEEEDYPGLAAMLGAYLRETIIATYGGAWDYFERPDQWGIRFEDDFGAFPISKVYKQLKDGEVHSILSFFTALPMIRDRANRQEGSE